MREQQNGVDSSVFLSFLGFRAGVPNLCKDIELDEDPTVAGQQSEECPYLSDYQMISDDLLLVLLQIKDVHTN